MRSHNTIMRFLLLFVATLLLSSTQPLFAQVTGEDSLQQGTANDRSTYISGYGEAKVSYDTRYANANANLTRVVVFIGHRFSKKVSFLSETELENARVEGDEEGGEIALEQAYLKFDINKNMSLQAGLFIPRIGIINENHLPTTFHGNDRPFTETLLIPSTWREIGICLNGTSQKIQGLNYTIALVNGLNSAGFKNGSGIREGRFEGSNATASNVALTGSLLYYYNDFRFQVSGYYGGSVGLNKREADSLQLDSGPFGTPVALGEANIQYTHKRFAARLLATWLQIVDAEKINRAYASNTAQTMLGGYAEVAYQVFPKQKISAFVRYENMDLNYNIPENGIENDILKKQYISVGLTCLPVKGVAIKFDYVYRQTGGLNPVLNLNPFPNAPAYYTTNSFINLGFGYSF